MIFPPGDGNYCVMDLCVVILEGAAGLQLSVRLGGGLSFRPVPPRQTGKHKETVMEKRLFVGNLAHSVGESDLETAFSDHGTVVTAVVVRDRETGCSRGFGFIEMETEDMAETAKGAMNGVEIDGRRIRVGDAQPKNEVQRRSEFGERW
jgi:cold-inducible RNA-binding protein